MTTQFKRTVCQYCGYLCGLIAKVEDGVVSELVPDETRYPYSKQIMNGCRRWKTILEDVYGESRINYPLRRVGKRGSGEFERITWDEALDEIAEKIESLSKHYGPQTIASAIGGPHTVYWPLHRFMNILGSPNNMGIGQICWNPRIWTETIQLGWTIEPDIQFGKTEVLMLWGTNPSQSDNSMFWRTILKLAKTDTKIIAVDPVYTQTARKSDDWLAITPGTDPVLLLALIREIIYEELYDKDFVSKYCYGFDELKTYVDSYTLQYAADVCGIAAASIQKLAHTLAHAQSFCIVSGRGVDQLGKNTLATHRSINILRAICGQIDKPGACVLNTKPDFVSELSLEMGEELTDEAKSFCLNTAITPLQCFKGYEEVLGYTQKHELALPMRYMTSAHPDLVFKAMLEHEPYPIKALIVQATNPLLTYANSEQVLSALKSLDLLVCLEHTMTSTTALADYILPVTGVLERPMLQLHGGVANLAYGGLAAIEPLHERKDEYDVYYELGKRLGQADKWPRKTLKEDILYCLEKAHVTEEYFEQYGSYAQAPQYYKYLQEDGEAKLRGFSTYSGKIELASTLFENLGAGRLPQVEIEEYVEIGGKNSINQSPRLHLISGNRKQPYNGSMYHNRKQFREVYPHPLATMSADTAHVLGLDEGDWVEVSNEVGSARFKLAFARMAPNVVSVDYGWWYPEQELKEPSFGGYKESNINELTDCDIQIFKGVIGTWKYNALRCEIKKVHTNI